MSGSRPRRTALTRARGRWGRVVLVVLVVAATFALFCVDAPTVRAAGGAVPSPVSAPDGRPHTVPPSHVDREPCDKHPGGHHCQGADHHGVPAQAPLVGADRSPALGESAAAPAGPAFDPSREPGAARPPDLHQLQLLRV